MLTICDWNTSPHRVKMPISPIDKQITDFQFVFTGQQYNIIRWTRPPFSSVFTKNKRTRPPFSPVFIKNKRNRPPFSSIFTKNKRNHPPFSSVSIKNKRNRPPFSSVSIKNKRNHPPFSSVFLRKTDVPRGWNKHFWEKQCVAHGRSIHPTLFQGIVLPHPAFFYYLCSHKFKYI